VDASFVQLDRSQNDMYPKVIDSDENYVSDKDYLYHQSGIMVVSFS